MILHCQKCSDILMKDIAPFPILPSSVCLNFVTRCPRCKAEHHILINTPTPDQKVLVVVNSKVIRIKRSRGDPGAGEEPGIRVL